MKIGQPNNRKMWLTFFGKHKYGEHTVNADNLQIIFSRFLYIFCGFCNYRLCCCFNNFISSYLTLGKLTRWSSGKDINIQLFGLCSLFYLVRRGTLIMFLSFFLFYFASIAWARKWSKSIWIIYILSYSASGRIYSWNSLLLLSALRFNQLNVRTSMDAHDYRTQNPT